MSSEVAVGLLFVALLMSMGLGVPVSFALGGTALLFTLFVWNPSSIYLIAYQAFDVFTSFALLALPLYIFMANVLERSGLATALYKMMHIWLGRVRGGLAIGTVLICTIFAAMTGVSGAATITMGLIALPAMLKYKYGKELSIGSIAAGGALGILIPPSITMVILGVIAGVSVGRLFAGGIFPGLLLSLLFIIYILIRSRLQPHLAPLLPPEEKADWHERLVSLSGVIAPIALISAVLGTIFLGICSVTESAAIGASGSIICAAIYRGLNWRILREACERTLILTSMVMWIVLGASAFTSFFAAMGGSHLIGNAVLGLQVDRWLIMVTMQLILILLGCVMETTGIIMITIPVFAPLVTTLGFDPIWFGILFILNMEMAFLTPPFGYNLFYMKAIVPKGITMGAIYRSAAPFVFLQLLALILCMIFPQIILFLPNLIFGS